MSDDLKIKLKKCIFYLELGFCVHINKMRINMGGYFTQLRQNSLHSFLFTEVLNI